MGGAGLASFPGFASIKRRREGLMKKKDYRIIEFVMEGQPDIKSTERIVGFTAIYDPEINRIIYSICLEQADD